MCTKIKFTLIWIMIFAFMTDAISQQQNNPGAEIPGVFQIGHFDDAFEGLTGQYHETLLSICGEDMTKAYAHWLDMLWAIETYAASVSFDLRGLQVYLYVFWEEDGRIAHLAFYPKPYSRPVSTRACTSFFAGFMQQYQLPLSAHSGFRHYASVSFPVRSARPQYKVGID